MAAAPRCGAETVVKEPLNWTIVVQWSFVGKGRRERDTYDADRCP